MSAKTISSAIHLMQLCDSALPVGGFAFSCGLESAAGQGVVSDVHSLEEFTKATVRQTLLTDGVAALHAFRNSHTMEELRRADRELYHRKSSCEWRTMSCRMGRKITELGAKILPCPELEEWNITISEGHTAGCYAVAQGLLFSLCGASEEELFAAVGYGTASMLMGAALRLIRISHHSTQQILFSLAPYIEELYGEAARLELHQMYGFVPMIDLFTSLHERGSARMFMS